MKHRWRLIDYDVWGNSKDGYEVNQAFRTSTVVEFADDISDDALIRLLKREGVLKKGVRKSRIGIDGDDQVIYFTDSKLDRPEFELQRED